MRHNDIPEPTPLMNRSLLARFIAGEASAAETVAVDRWLAQDPANGLELAELRRIWAQAGHLPSEARLDGLWRDLQRRMHEPLAKERTVLQVLQPRPSRIRAWTMGALVAAGIGAVAVGVAVRVTRTTPVVAHPPEQVYQTARGQRGVVELTDGSRVQLGTDSKIRVRLYDGGRREVLLDGEAVFDVVHDARRPFLVYAGNAVTEDLGTEFGVRAYRGDRGVRVVVASGQVALRPAQSAGAGDVLNARDIGELDAGGTVRVRRGVEPDTYLAWTRGRLVFRQDALPEIAAVLARWYDVDVVLADTGMTSRLLTLDLAAPSLEEALDAVVVPLGLRYERAGRRVTLYR